ncbi:MAG: GDP-mannose 4,6-dehydratase [Candidatus Aenigmatarchaeota archaeon]
MDNQGKRVLITGISGFVGSYLARELINRGYGVYGLVRKKSQKEKIKRLEILRIYDDVKLLDGDITNLTSLLMILNKIDPEIIFHLAAQSYVPYSFQNPLETFYPNCLGTQNLLEAVRLSEKIDPKIVFAGSSEEYGLLFRRNIMKNF